MMRIDVITAFPKIVQDPLNESILKQGQQRTELQINILDLRDFTTDKHRSIDDTPYGGGPGMILKAEPLFNVLEHIFAETGDRKSTRVVLPTPQGALFDQDAATGLSEAKHLVFICGHYKAIDERVIEAYVTDEYSVGDYILSGGELPALLMIDSIVRLIPGVIGDMESARTDSFRNDLLDCPYYTRPEEFRGRKVPEVLLNGNHQKIAEWRQEQKIARTRKRRPDLYKKFLSREKNK